MCDKNKNVYDTFETFQGSIFILMKQGERNIVDICTLRPFQTHIRLRACVMNPDVPLSSHNEGARFSKSLSLVKSRSGVTTLKTGSLLETVAHMAHPHP